MELGRTFYTTKGVNLEKYHLLSNVKKTYRLGVNQMRAIVCQSYSISSGIGVNGLTDLYSYDGYTGGAYPIMINIKSMLAKAPAKQRLGNDHKTRLNVSLNTGMIVSKNIGELAEYMSENQFAEK